MQTIIDEFQKQVAVFGSRLGPSLLMFAGFWLASIIVKKIICNVGKATDAAKQDVLNLIGQIARITLIVFGTVTALGTLGVNVSALVAGLGLTGFALGFAFRDALSNLLAGILILVYHPFRRGDRITVAGFDGSVLTIDLRYTTLQGDEKIFLIPNSTLFTNPISLIKKKDIAQQRAEEKPIASQTAEPKPAVETFRPPQPAAVR
jgi:small-conductance mechanosensitive channel